MTAFGLELILLFLIASAMLTAWTLLIIDCPPWTDCHDVIAGYLPAWVFPQGYRTMKMHGNQGFTSRER